MRIIGKLKAALRRKARKLGKPKAVPLGHGLTAQELWWRTHRAPEPVAERKGVQLAARRLAAIRKKHPATDPHRPASRQQIRFAQRKYGAA